MCDESIIYLAEVSFRLYLFGIIGLILNGLWPILVTAYSFFYKVFIELSSLLGSVTYYACACFGCTNFRLGICSASDSGISCFWVAVSANLE